MGFILDLILIAIIVICVVYGAKKGFFKSLMSFLSGICALLIAFTFTPALSAHLNEQYVLEPIAGGIETTFLSIAENEDSSGYDKDLLMDNSQFMSLMEGAGFSEKEVEKELYLSESGDGAVISYLAYTVAAPIAKTVSDILAFIILFVVSLILLKIITVVISVFLKLPVLKELDRTLGVVFGVLSAVFFAFVFSMMASHLASALSVAAPGTFTEDFIEGSLILELFAKYNPVSAISDLLIG